MKLEASMARYIGGMTQVQMQLAALKIQMVEITEGKEKQKQVWCTKCTTEVHHKDESPKFV